MAKVIWTDDAVEHLALIIEYLNQFNPAAAQRLGRRLFDAAESLREFPNRGRPVDGIRRELPTILPYVIRYRVAEDRVYILGIRHGARRPDPDWA